MAQARLNVNYIYYGNYKHELIDDDHCILCNDAGKEDMCHIFLKCLNQGCARGFICENNIKPDDKDNFWPSIFKCETKEVAIKTFYFIVNCLQARNFALIDDN